MSSYGINIAFLHRGPLGDTQGRLPLKHPHPGRTGAPAAPASGNATSLESL